MPTQIKNLVMKKQLPDIFRLVLLAAVTAIFMLPSALKAEDMSPSGVILLKAPQTAKQVEVEAEDWGITVNVDVQGWYCSGIFEDNKELVDKAIKKNDLDALRELAKDYLDAASEKDGYMFWWDLNAFHVAQYNGWQRPFRLKAGKKVATLSIENCYTKKELNAARDEAIRWANYIIKTLGQK